MKIYHGHPSGPSLEKCREIAPSYTHGALFSDKSGRNLNEEPYIIDNGAFAAFKNGEEWDPSEFMEMLKWATNKHPLDPEWVVVPDVVGEADETFIRSAEWAERIDHPIYQPVQDGMSFHDAIHFATTHGCSGIFVGGSMAWKRETARHWIQEAHNADLKCHIARPWCLHTAEQLGADSVDTNSIVAWGDWHKLEHLAHQQTIEASLARN